MQNKPLAKQLALYSTMAGSFLALSNESNGQIVYYDLAPNLILDVDVDETIYLYFDLNLDGVDDIKFKERRYDPCSYCVGSATDSADPLGANQMVYINSVWETFYGEIHSDDFAKPFGIGDVVEPGLDFSGIALKLRFFEPSEFSSSGTLVGPWADLTGFHYTGFKLEIDGNDHYGWIRLKSFLFYFEIDSYAYNINPDEPIAVGIVPDCNPPMPNGEVAITATTAKLRWLIADSVDHYELQYRAVGAASWITKEVAGIKNFRKVAGLTCNVNYEWQIRSVCTDGEISAYSPLQLFATNSCKIENELSVEEENIEIYSFSNQLYLNIEEEILEPAYVYIFDNLGRVVCEKEIIEQKNTFEINVPNGIYIFNFNLGSTQLFKKIIVIN